MNIYNQKKENTFIQEQKGPTYMQSTTSEYKAKEMSKHPQRERKKLNIATEEEETRCKKSWRK